MNAGVSIEVVWTDGDLIELRIRAANRRFSRTTDCYERSDFAARWSAAVAGFSSSNKDRRVLEI
jgi:hypothetical protein